MFEIIMLSGFLYAATSQMRRQKPEDSRKNGKASPRKSQTPPKKDKNSQQTTRPRQRQRKSFDDMMAA